MILLPNFRTIGAILGLIFLLACSSNPVAKTTVEKGKSQTASGTNVYDSFMQEERQWAGLTTKTVTIKNGMTLTYSESVNQSGPLVVMLHGYYGDRNNWNRIAHQMQNDFRIIIPDLPGHGDSEENPDKLYTFPEMASVLNEFANALKLPKFHLAGHSMGGGIAIQWSMIRHEDMLSLTLVDSAGKYRNNKSEVMAKILARENPMRIAQPGDAEKMLKVAMHLPPFIPASVMKDFETKQLSKLPIYDKVMEDMLKTEASLDADYFAIALKIFERPSLVLWGAEDRIFSLDVTKELTDALPNDKLVVIEGIGHTPLLEAAWPTAKAIREFLLTQ